MSATDTAPHLLKLLGLKDCIGQAGPYSAKNTCGTVGSAFLSIMQNVYRPLHPNNIAMLYVVGPKGKGHRGPRNRVNEPQFDDPGEFLAMVKTTARTAMNVVAHHNNNVAGTDHEDIIRDISWNLFSGGTYRHEDVTKLEVAQEIVRGIQSGKWGAANRFQMSFDKNVFQTAYDFLHQEKGTTATTCSYNTDKDSKEEGESCDDEELQLTKRSLNKSTPRRQKQASDKLMKAYNTTPSRQQIRPPMARPRQAGDDEEESTTLPQTVSYEEVCATVAMKLHEHERRAEEQWRLLQRNRAKQHGNSTKLVRMGNDKQTMSRATLKPPQEECQKTNKSDISDMGGVPWDCVNDAPLISDLRSPPTNKHRTTHIQHSDSGSHKPPHHRNVSQKFAEGLPIKRRADKSAAYADTTSNTAWDHDESEDSSHEESWDMSTCCNSDEAVDNLLSDEGRYEESTAVSAIDEEENSDESNDERVTSELRRI